VVVQADGSFSGGGDTKSSPQVGTDVMTKEITTKAAACPKQKFIIGGHSQGGMVTVSALRGLAKDPAILEKIIAVTMFGSPACPAQVKDRCQSYCHKGDFVSFVDLLDIGYGKTNCSGL
jgi:hypothetical protein